MAKKRLVDLQAANQLDISIQSITPAQAWKRQVRGVYSLIYLYAQQDFLHIEDFVEWIKNTYLKHQHVRCKSKPTSEPIQPSVLTDEKAKSYLTAAKPLGKIRKGISEAIRAIQDIYNVNNRNLD